MNRTRLASFGAAFLAAFLCVPVWASASQRTATVSNGGIGTINYVEGQVSNDGRTVGADTAGSVELEAGQALVTGQGRAEILLTPGIFFRVDRNSSVVMTSPDLANTALTLNSGRALIEVDEIHPANNIRIMEHGASTQLLKPGLYELDATAGSVRVFDGEAAVQAAGGEVSVKGGHELNLNVNDKLKAKKFDKNASADDFYRWASLRSSYLAEANVDAARRYSGANGWSPNLWYGTGWYWNPWFDVYTFIPADGIFWDPFGWGFYSPWYAFGAPYFGFGYYGYPVHRHFGPGYRPTVGSAFRSPAAGHAFAARGNAAFEGGGGFRGGGFGGARATGATGFRSGGFGGRMGGGFRSGGFGGGGRR